MKPNPQTPIIILYDKSEIQVSSGKQFLVVFDKGGQEHKISEKRQHLWAVFNNALNSEPFVIVYETYNNIQYVADAKAITEDLLKLAVRDMGFKLHNAQNEERNLSTSLSYAKDMLVGDKIFLKDLFTQARKNYEFIKGIEARQSDDSGQD